MLFFNLEIFLAGLGFVLTIVYFISGWPVSALFAFQLGSFAIAFWFGKIVARRVSADVQRQLLPPMLFWVIWLGGSLLIDLLAMDIIRIYSDISMIILVLLFLLGSRCKPPP